jgi:hypothetical protein
MYQVSDLFHQHKINLPKIHIQWETTSITQNHNIEIFEFASICFMFNCSDIY